MSDRGNDNNKFIAWSLTRKNMPCIADEGELCRAVFGDPVCTTCFEVAISTGEVK